MKYCVCGHGEDAHSKDMGCAVCECTHFIEEAIDDGDSDICVCGHNI